MRINRYLAQCALASRRKCEEYVLQGRVKANGKVITKLSYVVREGDIITVDNKVYRPAGKKIYLMLNKPKGYITTRQDEKDRKTVMDFLDQKYLRAGVFPVGRLDYNTEGLLLFTNDGDFAYKLTHPKYESEKEYRLTVAGEVSQEALQKLRMPLKVDGKMTRGAVIKVIKATEESTELSVQIREGKNRQIRRMCENAGLEVQRLMRVSVGGVKMKGLRRGAVRILSDEEIALLSKDAGQKKQKTRGKR
ncbi:MAG: rRNA pseudouridine synthase [Eubacteriaceae bacterium]|nr:rRNA pseudouridine synthase [Eubacteriaceae bacterium]